MQYSRYPSYRDSGVEWLSKVPQGWTSSYLKYIANINMGQSPSSSTYNNEGLGTEFLQGNADFGKLYPTARTFTTDAKKMSQAEDILFTVRAPVGAMNLSDKAYAIGRGLCAISSTRNSEKSFLWWLMPVVKVELDTVATGSTYEAVSVEQVGNSVVVLPPLQEQQTIANYLDISTAKIDTLIEKQTRLIELLKEKRQAVISTAVTRGLDPSVPMKDSGVEWLGEIPEGWEIKSLKTLLNKIIDNRGRTPTFGSQGVPMLEIRNITKGIITPTLDFQKYVHKDIVKEYERDKVKIGDLLISTVGATSGKTVIIKKEPNYFIAQNVVGLRTKNNILSEYLFYFLSSDYFFTSLMLINKGNTIDNLKVSVFINNKCFVPPISEQEIIIKHIYEITSKIDTLITKATKAIDLLKEKRTALISSVVTGKIDVRETA